LGPRGRIAVLAGTPEQPAEVFALDGGRLRPLSRQNDEWRAGVRLASVEEIDFRSRDGTAIGGFLVKPPDYDAGTQYPAILRLHGGPVYQFSNEFDFQWQLFAANGYVVIAPNPRGGSGRGQTFQKAIYADWGNLDVQDVLAAVDYVVALGVADSTRLAVGGWSYGGMLTNYVIASDPRFKAAISGAGIANILGGYGHDQYVREYEVELGRPWETLETWTRVSFPFLHADRIVTPTLYIVGQVDWNVPLLGSEQMYQALRSLGVETELVIYPGENHSIDRPSFQLDRLRRYVAWYDRFLKPVIPR
ncbi:MAG: alpha/beta hydrolase family protein, partial [Gemmatimonadota bacterium]